METGTASLKNYKQSPRKVRLLADLVRGKETTEAITLLRFSQKRASLSLGKLIESALANVRNAGAEAKDLFRIVNMTVDKGVVMKRSMPRARGRAFPIKKRTSHVTVLIARMEAPVSKAKKAEEKKVAKIAPVKAEVAKKATTIKKPAVRKAVAKKA